MTADGQS